MCGRNGVRRGSGSRGFREFCECGCGFWFCFRCDGNVLGGLEWGFDVVCFVIGEGKEFCVEKRLRGVLRCSGVRVVVEEW